MGAFYECPICQEQHRNLNQAVNCCETDKAQMANISNSAYMTICKAAEDATIEAVVAWLEDRKMMESYYINPEEAAEIALCLSAGDWK